MDAGERKQRRLNEQFLNRTQLNTTQHIASVARYFSTEASGHISGQVTQLVRYI